VAAPDRLAASFQAFSFFAAVCSKPAPYSVDSDMDFWDFVVRSEWPVVVAGLERRLRDRERCMVPGRASGFARNGKRVIPVNGAY
jgi:hypothetical protein